MAKLRPYVRSFLEQASTMFQMFIYTQARRIYAMGMVKLLDPGNKYFGSRVIEREDGTESKHKSLDAVLGQERAVVTVDDSKENWPNHKANLIRIRPYVYFASSCNRSTDFKPFSQRKKDERENPGVLVAILQLLIKIHDRFFSPRL
uniref:protein-serine/threonine phosphatase n=1 Tax=Rhizophora mucronata TaxID=61149 RepID=A0A2P2Q4E2_RHIMU